MDAVFSHLVSRVSPVICLLTWWPNHWMRANRHILLVAQRVELQVYSQHKPWRTLNDSEHMLEGLATSPSIPLPHNMPHISDLGAFEQQSETCCADIPDEGNIKPSYLKVEQTSLLQSKSDSHAMNTSQYIPVWAIKECSDRSSYILHLQHPSIALTFTVGFVLLQSIAASPRIVATISNQAQGSLGHFCSSLLCFFRLCLSFVHPKMSFIHTHFQYQTSNFRSFILTW